MSVRFEEWTQRPWWRPSVRAASLTVPLLTGALLHPFRADITSATAVLVFVVAVVAAAATGDRAAAVAAAVSSALWFDFFLTVPYLSFTIASADDVEATVLLVVISLVVTEVALWGRASSGRHRGARAISRAWQIPLARSWTATCPLKESIAWWRVASPTSSAWTTAGTSPGLSVMRGSRSWTTTEG